MISKNQIKTVTALSLKKNRDEAGLFVAEGTKLVDELRRYFTLKSCFATTEWLAENKNLLFDGIQEVSETEYSKISNQKSPQGILAVFEKPHYKELPDFSSELCLALDDVQDPGNLGTIIRIADWFGIKTVLCSLQCADAFSPKTVQATMGALARVKVIYKDLVELLSTQKVPVYGTFMQGDDIYKTTLSPNGIIVMGNEGNGISPAIEKMISHRITIPSFPHGEVNSESLNVAVATSIVCSEFRRQSEQAVQ